MLPTAGQTAGPNGLIFFVDTQGLWPAEWCFKLIFYLFFFKFIYFKMFFFHWQRRALQLVDYKMLYYLFTGWYFYWEW